MPTKRKEIDPEDLRSYELMVIIVPNIGEAGVNKELDKIRKLIKSYDAKITNEDIWGHRELAYRIKKHDAGFYAVINFEATTELLPELHKTLSIDNNVIRHMIVKPPKGYVLKTLQEYEAMDYTTDAEKEKAAKKAEAAARRSAPRKPATSAAPARKPRTTSAPVKDEKPVEKKEEKAETKKPEKKLADLDEKLKSIIDDTDLNL